MAASAGGRISGEAEGIPLPIMGRHGWGARAFLGGGGCRRRNRSRDADFGFWLLPLTQAGAETMSQRAGYTAAMTARGI